MPLTFKWYVDASLTTELTNLGQAFNSDGSTGAVDKVAYLGSVTSSKKLLASSNPGVDPIVISIVDSDGSGVGQAATAWKIALSAAGLDTAVAGDPINGPSQILSGAANALAVWFRINPANLAEASYTDTHPRAGSVVERVQ